MQYVLPDKTEEPEFSFIVRGGFEKDYYLFSDYEDAFYQADKLSYELGHPVFLYEALRCFGEWKAERIMTFCDGRAVEHDDDTPLHFKYYTDAGTWLNPPDDWYEIYD